MHGLFFKRFFTGIPPEQHACHKCNEYREGMYRLCEIMDDGITVTVAVPFMCEEGAAAQQAGKCDEQPFHMDDFLNNINPPQAAFR